MDKKEYDRIYYIKNKERISKRILEYKKLHPEAMVKASRNYIKNHPERIVELNRKNKPARKKWRGNNRPKVNALHTQQQIRKKIRLAGRPRPDHCEICDDPALTVFDHCHATGVFRGWLCNRCNLTLGAVRDSPELLRKLIVYLENTKSDADRIQLQVSADNPRLQ